ncbi:translation initiation factor IF-2 [Desulfoluna spongiiphila]|uniref:Translation initiation factor IF-2 n=1 Tax=Desulfoluna spongiiphila TaxID=419481 RepID=A0A1G5GNU0_9BACT|nr:translation initiation factor IF-2 [Desulfoluna spongiiphila]SCY53081.1 bacterial translation initiation factor 2 (bIF-2) [Desulfoluna spongiiphila]
MAKIRVYELAKSLNMTNRALLNKIEAMGIEVGSHMSSLEDETVELIRKNLFGDTDPETRDKRVRKTVIRRRKRSNDEENAEADEASEMEAPAGAEKEVERPEVEPPQPETADEAAPETTPPVEEAVEADTPVVAADDEAPDANAESDSVKPKKAKKSEPARIIKRPVADEPSPEEPEVPEVAPEPASVTPAPVAEAPEEPVAEVKNEEESVAEMNAEPAQEAAPVAEKVAEKDVTPAPEAGDAGKTGESDEADASAADKDEPKKKRKKVKKFTAAKIIKLPEPGTKPSFLKEKEAPTNRGNGYSRPAAPSRDRNERPAEPNMPPTGGEAAGDARGKKGRRGRGGEAGGDAYGARKKGRKKTVVEGNALYSEGRGRKGRKGGRHKQQPVGQKTQITVPKAIKRRIKVDDTIALSELAKRMGIKANDMIIKLMGMGVMATVNQTIDYDTAELVAVEFGFEVERAAFEEETILSTSVVDEDPSKRVTRSPVVTIMGHVDHGKTSLLDVIRKTSVTSGEAGGITQHIGAYHVQTENGAIAFLDTPGHEAFTAMCARGAKVTDLVILVVAADDGVMPQTVEALNHAKAAEVPIIVAVNKIDKPDADPDRVKRELSEHGVLAEDWGGDTIFVNVSAKSHEGISDLLDMVLLQAEVLELAANPDRLAIGHVVEAKLDIGRGPLATVLIQEGTLKSGQSVVCGMYHGKIRAMFNDKGEQVATAGPSMPVEIIGLTGVPEAGDEMVAVKDDKDAKQVSAHRVQKARARELAKNSRVTLDRLFEQMEEGEVKDLNLIIKADVHGSIEALRESLGKLTTSEVKVNVIHAATGTVTESDVSLAAVSNAIILGFAVRPATKVQNMAKEESVDMRFYDIIYDAIKDLKDAMVGLMESTFEEKILGRAEVRDTFVIPKKGTIAGCYVLEGKIVRGNKVRLLRDGVIVYDGNLGSLRRFKDDAKEVAQGYECGIGIENYNDVKLGDTIDCYYLEEIKPSLD